LTYNGTAVESNSSENIVVWDFLTGKKLRVFQAEKPEIWTTFEFSFDESFLAGIIETDPKDGSSKENILCVFDPLNNMGVIEDPESNTRRPIQLQNAQKFKWANKSNMMTCVCFGFGDEKSGKSQVSVIEIPSRKTYKWSHFTIDFLDCQIFWEREDKYIVLQLKTFGKKRIDNLLQVGVLDRKSKRMNVSTTELAQKFIQNIDIDQSAQRITVFSKNTEKELKVEITFYQITQDKNINLKEILNVKDPEFRFESITWSKVNQHFCLFDKKGNFRFGLLKGRITKEKNMPDTTKYEMESLCANINVGNNITYGNWDPSGRFLAVFSDRDSRVTVYNLFGEMAFSLNEDKSTHFIWRPRKKIVLTTKETDEIKKNAKKVYEVYNSEDEKILNLQEFLEKEAIKKRQETFYKYMNEGRKRWDDMSEKRNRLIGYDEDNLEELETVYIIDKEQFIEEVAVKV